MDDALLDLELIRAASMSEEDLRKCRQILATASIVMHETKLLVVFNEKWGRFTLPITKVKNTFLNDDGYQDATQEDWYRASLKAAEEHLGVGKACEGKYIMILDDFMASERDKATKRYTIGVYLYMAESTTLPNDAGRQWLTANQIMNETAPLMSQTALRVINQLVNSADELGLIL